MPKVSVTIPCYNSERFIAETIQSVLDQTFTDFEIIIINDGSSDKTEEIVRSFAGPRVKYFYQKNMGLSKTRNKLLELSSGEFIAFLDHDDVWFPHKLEKQMVLFEKNPEVVLVYSDCLVVDANGESTGRWIRQNKLYRGMVFRELLSCNFIPLSTVVLKKTVFREVGNFLPYRNAEEYDLFLKCASRHLFDYVDEPLAKYRIHASNYGRMHSDVAFKETIEIYNYWSQKKSIQDDTIKKIIKKSFSKSFYYYGRSIIYEEKNPSKARKYFRQGLKHDFNWKTFLLFLFSFINPLVLSKLSTIMKRTLRRY